MKDRQKIFQDAQRHYLKTGCYKPEHVRALLGNIQETVSAVWFDELSSIYYYERIDNDDGSVHYEVHGPNQSFITFEGPNAKAECEMFIKAANKGKL